MESNYRSIEAAQNMIIAIERQDSAELAHMFSQKMKQPWYLAKMKRYL